MALDVDPQTGAVNWLKTYSTASCELGRSLAVSVREVAAGGYVIAANTPSFGDGGEELWLLRLDSAGGVLWSRTYGGSEDVVAEDLRVTADGGFVMGGNGPGWDAYAAFVAKVDPNGELIWPRSYQLAFQHYLIVDVAELAGGGYVAVGGLDNGNNELAIREPTQPTRGRRDAQRWTKPAGQAPRVCTAQAGSGGMASGARDRPHMPGTATLKFRNATLNPRPAKEVGAPAGHPPLPAAGLAQPRTFAEPTGDR